MISPSGVQKAQIKYEQINENDKSASHGRFSPFRHPSSYCPSIREVESAQLESHQERSCAAHGSILDVLFSAGVFIGSAVSSRRIKFARPQDLGGFGGSS
jgi:hypothetical protein